MAIVSLLAEVADSKASQAAGAASSIMPSGVILPYAGNTAPTGWLVCDGAEYSQTTYASLFAALGSTYNTQLNPVTGVSWLAPSGGNFRVPDMRGMFMRGEGTPSGLDAVSVGGSQVQKTKANGLTVSGTTNINHTHSAASAVTGNTDIAHTHGASTISVTGLQHASNSYGYSPQPGQDRWDDRYNYGGQTAATGSAGGQSLGVTGVALSAGSAAAQSLTGTNTPTLTGTVASTDNETRPINRGVKYIIKV